MFTAAVAAKDDLPWEGMSNPLDILSSQVQALPYHIYTLAARIPNSEYTQRAQYGSVFVFLLLVALMSFSSMCPARQGACQAQMVNSRFS